MNVDDNTVPGWPTRDKKARRKRLWDARFVLSLVVIGAETILYMAAVWSMIWALALVHEGVDGDGHALMGLCCLLAAFAIDRMALHEPNPVRDAARTGRGRLVTGGEVRGAEFTSVVFGGYDAGEVDQVLDDAAATITMLTRELTREHGTDTKEGK